MGRNNQYRYTYREENPIRSALKAFCEGEPPEFVVGNDTSGLSDAQNEALQTWVSTNLRDGVAWSTGIGAIEAAELLVGVAVENANLPALKRCTGCRTPTMLEDLVTHGHRDVCERCSPRKRS
jgi:hypothetical protein